MSDHKPSLQKKPEFEKLLKDYPASPWVADANFGIAATLDAQGKSADAINKFEEVRKRFANSPVAEEAKLGAARLYEPQKPEEAYKLYDDLTKTSPGTSLAAEAAFRKEELERKHPELAKLNQPIIPATPAMPAPVQLTNIIRRTNMPAINLTNRVGSTGQPVQINLNPTPVPPPVPAPSPASPAPPPAK